MRNYNVEVAAVVICYCALLAPTARASYFTRSAVRKGAANEAWAKAAESPIPRVVSLLSELRVKVKQDGENEQKSYDKYACWCEETLAQKASDISAGKENIDALQALIVKLKGELGVHGADIEQLKKDVAANVASQKEATEIRSNERAAYQEEKSESEQCIGALEAAIGVLARAGTGKKGFLETLQEAQLLSAAASIRGILGRPAVRRATSQDDLNLIARFAERPEDFVGAHVEGVFLSAAEIKNNPFGDYAPQSTQIQGILKDMYGSFSSDLERANAEESVKQKSFDELMETKKAELKTLQATLQSQTTDEATKTKQVAESKASLDDAQAQLKNDETFFGETKSGCKAKAGEWAQRTRLRTEELQSFNKAIEILSGGSGTFENATSTLFLQFAAKRRGTDAVRRAYERVSALAARYSSLGLAKIAVSLNSNGHFDKVIAAIDKMLEVLRAEEADDIAHRDRCQGSTTQNKYHREDLNHSIKKSESQIVRMQDDQTRLEAKIEALNGDINNTKQDNVDLLNMRTKEHNDFLQAIRDDADAVSLLAQAITTLSEFYRSNGIPLSLRQSVARDPGANYSNAPPETTWASGDYRGRRTESGGIIAILSMIKEDLQKETQVAREQDASAQKTFEHDRKAIDDMLTSQKASKAALDTELAELQAKLVDVAEFKGMKGADLSAAQEKAEALGRDCSWVDTHFDSRRTKRKNEMDGLGEAKSYLLGVESGDQV